MNYFGVFIFPEIIKNPYISDCLQNTLPVVFQGLGGRLYATGEMAYTVSFALDGKGISLRSETPGPCTIGGKSRATFEITAR